MKNTCTAAGSVRSSAGTYTAWIDVMASCLGICDPFFQPDNSVLIVD